MPASIGYVITGEVYDAFNGAKVTGASITLSPIGKVGVPDPPTLINIQLLEFLRELLL